MKKIIAKPLAITAARQSKNNKDLILNQDCCVDDCNHLMSSLDHDTLERMCVIHQVGLNQLFYYQAELWENHNILLFRERGVGILKSLEDGVHLVREHVFEHFFPRDNNTKVNNSPHDFEDSIVTVGTFYPKSDDLDIYDLLPNTIKTSSGFITLEAGEFLLVDLEGNLKGGDVSDLVSMLQKNKFGFQLPSVKPRKPKQGTVVFNKGTKTFEGYNGKEWITLGG